MASLNEINAWLPLVVALVVTPGLGAFIGWGVFKEFYQ